MIDCLLALALWSLALNHAASGVHLFKHGLSWLLTSRDDAQRPTLSTLEERIARAQRNHIENLVVFFPLALLALHLGHTDHALLTTFGWAFVAARVAHLFFYAGGIPPLRSASHVVVLTCHLGLCLIIAGIL